MRGTSNSTAANAVAIEGGISSTSPGNNSGGVTGYNHDTSSSGIGVFGFQAGDGFGVWGQANGALGDGVYGSSASGFGVVGQTSAISGNWAVYGYGNIGATGTKSAIVPAEHGTHRTLYCLESPEC